MTLSFKKPDSWRIQSWQVRAVVFVEEVELKSAPSMSEEIAPGVWFVPERDWDGSYHDPHYVVTGMPNCLIYVGSKRGGWIGRFRKTARAFVEKATADHQVGGTIARRKGIYREGD